MKRSDTKRGGNPIHGRRKKKAFRKKNFWCSIYKRNDHIFPFIEEALLFIAYKYLKMKGRGQSEKKYSFSELLVNIHISFHWTRYYLAILLLYTYSSPYRMIPSIKFPISFP